MTEDYAQRADGWPLCPRCGEDEVWSPIWNTDRPRPSLNEFLAGPLACYACGWRDPGPRPPVLPADHPLVVRGMEVVRRLLEGA